MVVTVSVTVTGPPGTTGAGVMDEATTATFAGDTVGWTSVLLASGMGVIMIGSSEAV